MGKSITVSVSTLVKLAVLVVVVASVTVGGLWAAGIIERSTDQTPRTPWDPKPGQPMFQPAAPAAPQASTPQYVPPPPPQPQLEKVPMLVTWRPAVLGTSFVMQIRNDSGKLMRGVKIRVKNSSREGSKEWNAEAIASDHFQELGWNEGWEFYPGDEITFTADGYAPYVLKFTGK